MRSVKTASTIIAATLGCLAVSGAARADGHDFNPVGRWRFFHTDGKPFTARLAPDQTAATDFGGGEHGIWRWEGQSVRVIYTDGWDDVLTRSPDRRFTKTGWSPGADRCAQPSNRGPAEHLSADPGAPLRLRGR